MADARNTSLVEQVTVTLDKVFANVNSWLFFAEAKNATLLALNGAGIYGLVSLLLNADYTGGKYLTLYLWVVVIFLCLGIVVSLLSFSPVGTAFGSKKKLLSQDKSNLNLLFYGDLIKYHDSKEYVVDLYKHYYQVDLAVNEVSKIHRDYADEILINSRITVKKLAFFKYALFLDLSGVLTPLVFGVIFLCYTGIKKIMSS